jgi:putative oxidoreductase
MRSPISRIRHIRNGWRADETGGFFMKAERLLVDGAPASMLWVVKSAIQTPPSLPWSKRLRPESANESFAEGWPGAGLLLQRVLTSTILLHFGATHLLQTTRLAPSLPYLIAAVAGVFLLLGLWTPVAGITIATVEVWISLAWSGNWLFAIVLAGLGATVAMIGPGLWSIDARLYGRKHLQDPRR